MGGGIAQVCATAGFETITHDLFLTRDNPKVGIGAIRGRLQRQVDQKRIDQSTMDGIMGRLSDTTRLEDFVDCDIVVEAVVERLEDKQAVFRTLDDVCRPEVILASNTSSVNVMAIAAATKRADRVLGMHFFNPPPVMKLLELVRTIATSDATLTAAREFGERLGKHPIVAKDRAGFIVNYLLVPYLFDAIRLYEQGFATREDIDAGMVEGCNHPMGPLTLGDFVGLDVCYYVGLVLYEEFKEPRYAPPPLLHRMILAGQLGRKTGKGFYDYS
ncbi:MAG TPA: 3-hydroxybutyryl-CoA dehydrogenase [Chloroflexota bacterium]|nr:3-hydroxybutyryl-CoA dehydrogenase [Chloroflexota bacterium]